MDSLVNKGSINNGYSKKINEKKKPPNSLFLDITIHIQNDDMFFKGDERNIKKCAVLYLTAKSHFITALEKLESFSLENRYI